jgi:hypothetical protein
MSTSPAVIDGFARHGWTSTRWGKTEHFRLTKEQQSRFETAKQLGYLEHADGKRDVALAELWGIWCENQGIPDATIRVRGRSCKIVIDLIFLGDFRLSHYESELLLEIWRSWLHQLPNAKRLEGSFGTYCDCQVPPELADPLMRRLLDVIEQLHRGSRISGSSDPQYDAWHELLHSTIPPCKCRPGKRPCMYCAAGLHGPERRGGYYASI